MHRTHDRFRYDDYLSLDCVLRIPASFIRLFVVQVMYALNFITYGIDSFFLFALYKVHGGYLNSPAVTQPQPAPPPPQFQQQHPSMAPYMQQQQQQPQQLHHPMEQPAYPGPMYSNPGYDVHSETNPYAESDYTN